MSFFMYKFRNAKGGIYQMKDFNIIIEEHITQGFLLSAKSWEEAEMLLMRRKMTQKKR